MGTQSKKLILTASLAAIMLSACSGEPSNSDIKSALEEQMVLVNAEMQKQMAAVQSAPGVKQEDLDKLKNMTIVVKNTKKVKCDKQADSAYTCEVEVTMTMPPLGTQVTHTGPIVLVKEGSSWKAAGGMPAMK